MDDEQLNLVIQRIMERVFTVSKRLGCDFPEKAYDRQLIGHR